LLPLESEAGSGFERRWNPTHAARLLPGPVSGAVRIVRAQIQRRSASPKERHRPRQFPAWPSHACPKHGTGEPRAPAKLTMGQRSSSARAYPDSGGARRTGACKLAPLLRSECGRKAQAYVIMIV
jgi:hypothetical protein